MSPPCIFNKVFEVKIDIIIAHQATIPKMYDTSQALQLSKKIWSLV